MESAPAAPPKASAAATELTATLVPAKAVGPAAGSALPLEGWAYHDPPRFLDTSQAQALLCVFLI